MTASSRISLALHAGYMLSGLPNKHLEMPLRKRDNAFL